MYDEDRHVGFVKGGEKKLFTLLFFGIRLRFLTVEAHLADPLVL